MIKMLDHLNQRDIAVNTVSGAEKALEILLRNNTNRIKHSRAVAMVALEIASKMELSDELKEIILISALLHDIGYSEDFKFADFHPIDGYYYLMSNNWKEVYRMVALHHTHSYELAKMSRKDVLSIYESKPLDPEFELIVNIISEADFTVNSEGEIVSSKERLEDIKFRYGNESPISIHAEFCYNKIKNKS